MPFIVKERMAANEIQGSRAGQVCPEVLEATARLVVEQSRSMQCGSCRVGAQLLQSGNATGAADEVVRHQSQSHPQSQYLACPSTTMMTLADWGALGSRRQQEENNTLP
jgi:hypothetical protein